jgi:signal transduction histidine kinase
MVTFFALFSWRSFVERERFMVHLRPFVDSQSLIQHLAHPGENLPARASGIFLALCRDILAAQSAQLIPLGALAPLAGPPLTYPPDSPPRDIALSLDSLFASPGARFMSLDPAEHGGFLWAVPLWAERGPIGVLCLGEKQDGGLYTQEEIEIAQTSSERLVDGLAGEQMARCLMDLQRHRLTETQVLDRRTRRVLHDKILPDLHTTVLSLSNLAREHPAVQEAIAALTDTHRQIADLIHTLPGPAPGAPSGRHLVEALQEMMRVEFAGEFDRVTWAITGPPPELSPLVTEVVFYAVREAVRNAALHGRGGQRERLHLAILVAHEGALTITVEDDGVGLAYDQLEPEEKGPLPTGSHGGLALHRAMMAVIGGALIAETPKGGGARVTITLPVSEVSRFPPAGSSGQS